MKKTILVCLCSTIMTITLAQEEIQSGDSLKQIGLLMPALERYAEAFSQDQSTEISYKIASTCALLWTTQMKDTAFYFLKHSLQQDSTLQALYDPHFLSLIDDPRWKEVETNQIKKYETVNGRIKKKEFAQALFRMIIRDQGFMYAGNIERRKYMKNGGYFESPSIFPMLAMEEKNVQKNTKELLELLDEYGWPTASQVTEYAAAGAALIINHTTYELRAKYFPMLKSAFEAGEAQPLRFAKMQDRLLVEEGKEQLYGTQIKFEDMVRVPYPIKEPAYVDKRREKIGLGPLSPYLKARFDIEWNIKQKQ